MCVITLFHSNANHPEVTLVFILATSLNASPSSSLSPLHFIWHAGACLILKPGSGLITLSKPYTGFMLEAEWSMNLSAYLPGLSHNVDPNCRSCLISYHFLFKATANLAKPITLPWTCLHFSSLGPLLAQNAPLVYRKLPYPSGPILNAGYEKLLLMPLISVTTAPTKPRPLPNTSQTWASFLSSSVYSKLLEGDKCALLTSLNLHGRMVPNTKVEFKDYQCWEVFKGKHLERGCF